MRSTATRLASVAAAAVLAVGCSDPAREQTHLGGDDALARLDAMVETAVEVAGGEYEPPVYALRALCHPDTFEHGADQVRAVVSPWPRDEPLTSEQVADLADAIRDDLEEAGVFPPADESAERHDADPDPAAPPVWQVTYEDGGTWLDVTPYDIRALAAIAPGSADASDRVVSDGRDCDDQRADADADATEAEGG